MTKVVFTVILLVGIVACAKHPDFPVEPLLSKASVETERIVLPPDTEGQDSTIQDIVKLKFSFTDGDGDIGADEQVNSPNFFADFYVWKNGKFVPALQPPDEVDSIVFPYRIPRVQSANGSQMREGDIIVSIDVTARPSDTTFLGDLIPIDTMQFQYYLFDRAGHKSNVINTGTVVLK